MNTGTCRTPSCRATILFARHYKTGTNMPFDQVGCSGTTPGAFALIGHFAYPRDVAIKQVSDTEKVSVVQAAERLDNRDAWHISHFATCPGAGKHRQPRGAPRPQTLGGTAPEQGTLL